MILIIIIALISSVVMILLMPINIKKLNKIAIDKELNKISLILCAAPNPDAQEQITIKKWKMKKRK